MKAIIAGAGIAGLTAAYELGRMGWDVTVLERAKELRSGGYMIDFFGPGYDAAEENGLLDGLACRAHAIDGVELVNGDGSHQAYMSYAALRASLGGRLFSLMRGDIEQVLFEALPGSVALRFGSEVIAVEDRDTGVAVVLDDGTGAEADLLIGADGLHSGLRRQMFCGEAEALKFLGYHTAAYIFRSQAVAEAAKGNFTMLSLPGRQAGIFRMQGDQVAVYFLWRDARPERAADTRQAIAEQFGDLGWLIPEILAGAPENADIYYDVVAQIEAEHWHGKRTVLIGDAAYAVSLLAGQGASLAIGGAHLLARMLAEHDDIGAALVAFERVMRPEAEKKQAAGRRTAEWIVPSSRFRVWLRAIVFNFSSLPIVSRLIGGLVPPSPKGIFAGATKGQHT
ncbi:FAD-dependent oxidoreductase [Solirhodobacter olei]|uniref:FAD-dependent oxidoreductase n=1 Tax=Solirhodobacter olei TaxID=2493082 RepID=UPI000FD9E968|nr:FAD-dependent oxidoreductase [Solirhodobacter olei]